MNYVITATGKRYRCDYFNCYPEAGQVNIRVLDVPITSVAMVFSDAQETKQLQYGDQSLLKYTKLLAIVPEGIATRVVLERR